MQHVTDILDLVGNKLDGVANNNVVIGKPMELGKVTVVPVSRVHMGFGGGGGQGEGEHPHHRGKGKQCHRGKGLGGGGGGGGKVRPVGVIVFKETGVEVLAVPDKQGVFEKLFEKIPELAEKLKVFKDD